MPYMVTFTINIPQMLAYIPAPWILWDIIHPNNSRQCPEAGHHFLQFGDSREIARPEDDAFGSLGRHQPMRRPGVILLHGR